MVEPEDSDPIKKVMDEVRRIFDDPEEPLLRRTLEGKPLSIELREERTILSGENPRRETFWGEPDATVTIFHTNEGGSSGREYAHLIFEAPRRILLLTNYWEYVGGGTTSSGLDVPQERRDAVEEDINQLFIDLHGSISRDDV